MGRGNDSNRSTAMTVSSDGQQRYWEGSSGAIWRKWCRWRRDLDSKKGGRGWSSWEGGAMYWRVMWTVLGEIGVGAMVCEGPCGERGRRG